MYPTRYDRAQKRNAFSADGTVPVVVVVVVVVVVAQHPRQVAYKAREHAGHARSFEANSQAYSDIMAFAMIRICPEECLSPHVARTVSANQQ
ncbi:hypothetical protein F5Y07DRAFT_394931 [Xylaria sp. FL0933]|nr:hypothetical protein F5Y07DRAFT_394931 [Xylaria sp. FL0933]